MERQLVRNPLSDQIAAELRRDIITGAVLDGSHLTEENVAARFGVSRGPVREALRTLTTEGHVTSVRGRIYVRALGPHDVHELYSLRTSLEELALRSTFENPLLRDALRDSVASMAASVTRADEGAMADADLEFHSVLYRLAGNSRLLDTWERYAPTFSVLLRLSNTPDPDSAVEDHQRIVALIDAGDVDDAVAELIAHIARGEAIVRRRVIELAATRASTQTASDPALPASSPRTLRENRPS